VVNSIHLLLSIHLYINSALRRVPKDSLLCVEDGQPCLKVQTQSAKWLGNMLILRQSVHTSSQGPLPTHRSNRYMGPDEQPAIDRDLTRRSSLSTYTPLITSFPILRNYVNRKLYSFCPYKTLQLDTVTKYTLKQQTHNLSHKLNLGILFEQNRLTKRYMWTLHWGRRKLNCAASHTEHITHHQFRTYSTTSKFVTHTPTTHSKPAIFYDIGTRQTSRIR